MYKYTINYWDTINQEPSEDSGLVSMNTYGDAANKIVEFYGQENIVDMTLSEMVPILSKEEIIDMFMSK